MGIATEYVNSYKTCESGQSNAAEGRHYSDLVFMCDALGRPAQLLDFIGCGTTLQNPLGLHMLFPHF